MAVDAFGMPVRLIVTQGTEADCRQALALITGIRAEALLADRAYDTEEIVSFALTEGMEVVIPQKRNRIKQRSHDQYLYKMRHLVENAFMRLKQWRGVATRYSKRSTSFLAAAQIRCISLWLQTS